MGSGVYLALMPPDLRIALLAACILVQAAVFPGRITERFACDTAMLRLDRVKPIERLVLVD